MKKRVKDMKVGEIALVPMRVTQIDLAGDYCLAEVNEDHRTGMYFWICDGKEREYEMVAQPFQIGDRVVMEGEADPSDIGIVKGVDGDTIWVLWIDDECYEHYDRSALEHALPEVS